MEDGQKAPFHVVHKVPAGDGLYVRAKHVQLVERNPDKAIALFRVALEAGDRVDSALKDMAIVLKQQNRPNDAILAISTFRARCSDSAQDSLDNVLLDLYKSCGRLDDQIALLIRKLQLFNHSQTFNGKRTKTARSQGKKFQVSVEQETARLLGNLGWAYMQQSNYAAAESVYRRALALEVDNNKVCNLGVCLMKQGRAEEAIAVLKRASYVKNKRANSESHLKSYERAQELICQASSMLMSRHRFHFADDDDDDASLASTSSDSIPDSAWHEGMQLHGPGDVCSHIDASNNEDARKMSEMVAAAWLRACNDARENNGSDSNDAQQNNDGNSNSADAGHTLEEVYAFSAGHIEVYAFSAGLIDGDEHSLPPAPFPIPALSSDLLRSAQGGRRLPVFRDITVLGSAAA